MSIDKGFSKKDLPTDVREEILQAEDAIMMVSEGNEQWTLLRGITWKNFL